MNEQKNYNLLVSLMIFLTISSVTPEAWLQKLKLEIIHNKYTIQKNSNFMDFLLIQI